MAEGQGKSKAAEHGSTAHTAADGGHKAAFPPFESNTFASQLVSFAIAFGLLYLIVSRLALPRVGGVLASRQQVIDTDLNEAARLKADSDAALKAYETELANARAKAQAMAAEVRERLNAQQEAARNVTLKDGASVEDLIQSLVAIRSTPRDIIAILQALQAAGALDAEIEVI